MHRYSSFYRFINSNFVCLKFICGILFFWIFFNLFPFILLSSLQLQTCFPNIPHSFPCIPYSILDTFHFSYYNNINCPPFTNIFIVIPLYLYYNYNIPMFLFAVDLLLAITFPFFLCRSYFLFYLKFLSSLQLQTTFPTYFSEVFL